jgi:hypothetical protein
MAAYYTAIAYYAVGPERLAAWGKPRLERVRSGASRAGSAAARTAGGLVVWAKGMNWRDPESLMEIHI